MHSTIFRLALIVTISLLAAAESPRAYATNQVVGDCGDSGGANQLRAKIDVAQGTGGGVITFTCSTPIILNGTVLPSIISNLTIDGGNTVTISGASLSPIFFVSNGGDLTLKNITLTKGWIDGDGGAIRNEGTLTINHSKFLDNHTTAAGSGGAILTLGFTTITDSEFANNSAANGGALYDKWPNASTGILDSNFHDNTTLDTSTGWGGAILVFDGAYLELDNSTVSANYAGLGGAVYLYSGAATSTGVINSSDVHHNKGYASGGGFFSRHSRLELNNTYVHENGTEMPSSGGGGIFDLAGTLTVNHSAFVENSALPAGNGGNAYGGGIYSTGAMTLTNVTLSGNIAFTSGAGIYNSGAAKIYSATFYQNSGISGAIGGIRNDGSAVLKNTILVYSASNPNCGGAAVSGSFNLSNDGSCAFGAGHDNVDALLGNLANNGGETPSHLPSSHPVSPAIDNGQCLNIDGVFIYTDQRGLTRPYGLACDIGAVEVGPQLWLPLIRR